MPVSVTTIEQLAVVAGELDGDRATGLREFDCIRQQIPYDLLQTISVARR